MFISGLESASEEYPQPTEAQITAYTAPEPTLQDLLAYRARLLAVLAGDLLLFRERCDPSEGLRLLRDELLSLSTAIHGLEQEEVLSLSQVLTRMRSERVGSVLL
jgi:hypothetical protein